MYRKVRPCVRRYRTELDKKTEALYFQYVAALGFGNIAPAIAPILRRV